MGSHILYFLLEVAVQTVLLAVALWIMILIQKLNYRFLGLLGTTALVSAIDQGLNQVLGHSLGSYAASTISTPFVLAALYFCLKKLTQADRTDIYYTAGVGYALVFVMNLWLMGALLGNLRPSARHADEAETAAPALETNLAPPVVVAAKPTNAPVPIAPVITGPENPPTTASVAGQSFTVTGIIRNGSRSVVTIQSGTKSYPMFLGDKFTLDLASGPVSAVLKELDANWAVLTVNGTDIKLGLP